MMAVVLSARPGIIAAFAAVAAVNSIKCGVGIVRAFESGSPLRGFEPRHGHVE